jgi:hypothetical protein
MPLKSVSEAMPPQPQTQQLPARCPVMWRAIFLSWSATSTSNSFTSAHLLIWSSSLISAARILREWVHWTHNPCYSVVDICMLCLH